MYFFFGIPALVLYGALALAQWNEGIALSRFETLRKSYSPDSLYPVAAKIAERELSVLGCASRMAPSDPEPVFQAALLNLMLAEKLSLSPESPSMEIGGGPDPRLSRLLRDGLRLIRRAISLNPGAAEYHFVQALLLQNIGGESNGPNLESASVAQSVLLHLENSDHLDPYKPSLQYRIGSFQLALGNQEKARKALSKALEQDPDLWKQIFPVLWTVAGSPDDMRSFVVHNPRICVQLGSFLMGRGFRKEAEAEYAEAAARGERDFAVLPGLVSFYFSRQDYAKVLDLIQRVERAEHITDPFERFTLRSYEGMAHALSGDVDAAVSSYEAALQVDDTRLHIHHLLADLFLRQGEYRKAIARWRFVLGRDLEHGQLSEAAHLGLAQAYERQGKYTQALAEYLKASAMNPQNTWVEGKIQEISGRM